jgi:hypothetical protein
MHKNIYPVEMMCKVLEVSRSSYNNWLLRKYIKREEYVQSMEAKIRSVYLKQKYNYNKFKTQ